jgi:hypothetical protein
MRRKAWASAAGASLAVLFVAGAAHSRPPIVPVLSVDAAEITAHPMAHPMAPECFATAERRLTCGGIDLSWSGAAPRRR